MSDKRNSYILSIGEFIKLLGVAHVNPEVKPKSFLVVGESGIGKTEGVEELCQELGVSYYNIRTPEIEPYDLVGNWDPNTGKYVTPLLPKKGEPAIILMDEINRGQVPTMQACMRIMEGRGTSTFQYDSSIQTIVAAANPVSEDDIVEILGRALINRPYILFVEPGIEEWAQWMRGIQKKPDIKNMKYKKEDIESKIKNYREKIALFLLTYPKYLIGKGSPDMASKFESVPNPRNWYESAKIITLFELAEIEKSISAMIGTKVGFTTAADFEAFLIDPEPPVSGTQVLEEYSKYKAIFLKHQKSARHKAIATVRDVGICTNKSSLNKKEMTNISAFINDIDDNNSELAMAFFKALDIDKFNSIALNNTKFFEKNIKIIEEINKKFKKGG